MRVFLSLLLGLLAAATAGAQTFRITGEVRERSEPEQQPGTTERGDVIHLLRTRLGLAASFRNEIGAVVEMQDTRRFGGEPNAFGADVPFNLRQGYIEAWRIGGSPIGVKVGRQVLSYANERLLGEVDWSNAGQWFDAAVIRADLGETTVDLLGGAIAQRPDRPVYSPDAFLIGAWGTWAPATTSASFQAFYLFDDPANIAVRQDRHTLGVHADGKLHGFDYELDGAAQFGYHYVSESGVDRIPIMANMVGTRLGYTLDSSLALRIGIGYDLLSGDTPGKGDAYRSFHTLYATNHRFFGSMDYFSDVPRATRGNGLRNIVAEASASPVSGLHISAALHLFSLAEDPMDRSVIDPDPSLPPYSSRIGNELDIGIFYTATEWLRIGAGYSIFQADPGRYVLPGPETAQWGFFTLTAEL